MSAAGVIVQGVVYAAFILAEEENSSEPLLAVMLKLDPSDGMTYKCLETEAELHGRHFWSTKIGLDIPTKCPWRLWRQLTSYGLIISGFVMEGNSRIPIQEWSLFLIVSPSLERLQGLILPETAQRCRLVKSSSLMPDGAPPASPEDIPAGEQFEGERPSTD